MNVCVHSCIYACIHLGMYVPDLHKYAHIYACMHAFVHECVPNLYSHVTVDIFHMSLNKYGCHIPNIRHTAIMLYGHIYPTFCVCVSELN